MLNKVRLWIREISRTMLDDLLNFFGAIIGLLLIIYGCLATNTSIVERGLFGFKFYKRISVAVKKLELLDQIVDLPFNEKLGGVMIRKGTIKVDEVGFKELLKVFKYLKSDVENIHEIILEEMKIPTGNWDNVTLSCETKDFYSLKLIGVGKVVETNISTNELVKKAHEIICQRLGIISIIGGLILFIIAVSSIVSRHFIN